MARPFGLQENELQMKKDTLLIHCALIATLLAGVSIAGCSSQNNGSSARQTIVTTPAPASDAPAQTPQTASVFRVKAGVSTPFTDASGHVWLPDQGFEGGETTDRDSGTTIAGTKDPDLFLSEHYGMNSFSCKIPNGKHTAKLYFAETFDGITGPGQRVFSFNAQGHEFKDFDVWVKAGGPNRAYVESIPVEVSNGIFHIDFISNIENPEINAIELVPHD
jgi:hypothetical protein